MKLNVSVRAWKSTERRLQQKKEGVAAYKKRNAYILEELLPTVSQEDQNSRRISRKVCGSSAEAPRKGGPVFPGKWPHSMGSPMEPKPTQAAAKLYLT